MPFLKVPANPGMHLVLHADTACVTLSHVIPLLPLPLFCTCSHDDTTDTTDTNDTNDTSDTNLSGYTLVRQKVALFLYGQDRLHMTDFQPQTGFLDVEGAPLYYEIAGTGYPFLLIHAGVADSRMWDQQFQTCAQHYQVIRYDLRGFGQSSVPAGPFANHKDTFAL